MHNKACQPMSASRLLGRGEIVIGAHGCTLTFVIPQNGISSPSGMSTGCR
jgi:hypothetical protein